MSPTMLLPSRLVLLLILALSGGASAAADSMDKAKAATRDAWEANKAAAGDAWDAAKRRTAEALEQGKEEAEPRRDARGIGAERHSGRSQHRRHAGKRAQMVDYLAAVIGRRQHHDPAEPRNLVRGEIVADQDAPQRMRHEMDAPTGCFAAPGEPFADGSAGKPFDGLLARRVSDVGDPVPSRGQGILERPHGAFGPPQSMQ
ncbi:MAG: hypothetical protein RLW61_10975 [Gammaproteobacteria bacterium]